MTREAPLDVTPLELLDDALARGSEGQVEPEHAVEEIALARVMFDGWTPMGDSGAPDAIADGEPDRDTAVDAGSDAPDGDADAGGCKVGLGRLRQRNDRL